ncbi:tubulin-specific chaperone E [Macrosteles quadrilineatus]|uniref:tubulin-specific chaperone E n=1 Tax=Macrosteles quadrilineatus TaxID=74068 RepID=UPI0023E227E6|nr:tubulin-specific chaperone E [Macrosteles quadrilineatus]XP_054281833.1 tubulin-specific chaperone E [Macrosteles quadrilineatus]
MVSCECPGDAVGRRVAVGEHRGTVQYVGAVPPAPGVWLGVEWDDPSRGKHDGMYNGVRYFQTRLPTAGSFVRLEKADFGRSCVAAIQERYGNNDVTLTVEELQDLQRAMNAPNVEMVGFEKINQLQRCFSNLQVVCLSNQQVWCAGEGLDSMCPNVQEIDLSYNLFTSWDQVAEIVVNFPNLKFLRLNNNRLRVPENPEKFQLAFRSLSHLVLGNMDYTWEEICTCSKMWPQIESLQVPFNNITTICLPENTLVNLTNLDLEGNPIMEWKEINQLGKLDRLGTLNLSSLGLTDISLPESQSLFKTLHCLLISDNKISKWESISELHKLPKLHELRFSRNPLLENMKVESVHYKIIARIGPLQILNGSPVTKGDRRGAEMEYLKEHGREWLECTKNEELKAQFVAKHPRYPLLIKKHGVCEESELEVKCRSLKSDLVHVKFVSNDGKTIKKTVPSTMLLSRLTGLVQRLFNTGNAEPTLCYHSCKNSEIEVKMDDPLKSLDYYSIEDGDEIQVQW